MCINRRTITRRHQNILPLMSQLWQNLRYKQNTTTTNNKVEYRISIHLEKVESTNKKIEPNLIIQVNRRRWRISTQRRTGCPSKSNRTRSRIRWGWRTNNTSWIQMNRLLTGHSWNMKGIKRNQNYDEMTKRNMRID